MNAKPWLDDNGRPTEDARHRAREVVLRIGVQNGIWRRLSCPACGSELDVGKPLSAVFATHHKQGTAIEMPFLLVKCQCCPYMFTFDVGQNGFGDLPEREGAGVLPKGVAKLKDLPCYESKGAPLAQQLLHVMLRSHKWGSAERPKNYPLWLPKDFGYHLEHMFSRTATKSEIEKALVQLQEDGTVRRTDGGWRVVEDEA